MRKWLAKPYILTAKPQKLGVSETVHDKNSKNTLDEIADPRLYEFQHVRNAPAFEWGRTNPDFFMPATPRAEIEKSAGFSTEIIFCNLQPYPDSRLPPSIACTCPFHKQAHTAQQIYPPVPYPLGDMRLPSALPVVLKNTFYRLHGL